MRKITPSKGRKHPGPRAAPALVNPPSGVFPARRQTPGAFEEALPKRDTNLTRVSAGRLLSDCLPSRRWCQTGAPRRRASAAGRGNFRRRRPSPLALRSVSGRVSAQRWRVSARDGGFGCRRYSSLTFRFGPRAWSAGRVGGCRLLGWVVSVAVGRPSAGSAGRVGGCRLRGWGGFGCRRFFLAGLQVRPGPGRRAGSAGAGCGDGAASVAVGSSSLASRFVPGPVGGPGRRVPAPGPGGFHRCPQTLASPARPAALP